MTSRRRINEEQTRQRDPAEGGRVEGQKDSASRVEGEGSYSGTREYNERTRRFIEERGGDVHPDELSPEQEAEGEEAMQEGLEHAREVDQDERDAEEFAGPSPLEGGAIEREQLPPAGRSGIERERPRDQDRP